MPRTLGAMLRRWERGKRRPRPTTHPTPTCAAILRCLRAQGMDIPGPDEHWRIRRTYSGRHQRTVGAWSWSLEWVGDQSAPHRVLQVGSIFPAKECAKPGATLYYPPHGDPELWPAGVG